MTPAGKAGAVWVLSTTGVLPEPVCAVVVVFAAPAEKVFTESAQCWST